MFNEKIDAMLTKINGAKPEHEPEHEILNPKIIKPIELMMNFEDQEEFFDYYNSHKTEMDNLTTHKLNKLFTIDGYRITKIKNVLKLKQIQIQNHMNFEQIANRITVLEDALNRIIEYINSTVC
jgi:hypothetical protein